MLIKLICDGNCGFVKRLGASEMRVGWTVETDLPLCETTQLKSLNAAIDKTRRDADDAASGAVTHTDAVCDLFHPFRLTLPASAEELDVRRTPNELGLKNGAVLHLTCTNSHPSRGRSGSLFSTASNFSHHQSVSRLRASSAAPNADVNTDDETDEENEERYLAHDIGWFPFMLRPREGEPLAVFAHPLETVREEDAAPKTEPLCETCCAIVSHGDAVRVGVDMHCKPMLMRQDFLEVCMEKLGGGQLQRWQTRYVQISEKSVDWFAEKPKPGVKSRIHGHRYIVRDGACQVEELLPNPDPDKYPKCRDEHFFHFGIRFVDPGKTYFFRVTTAQKRAIVVEFLDACIKQAQKRAPMRNPVVWKQRADAYLVNAAQLGEQHTQNRMEMESLHAEAEALEAELQTLLDRKPKLQSALQSQTHYIHALRAELMGYEVRSKKSQQRLRTAADRVAAEEQLLRAKELEMSDAVRRVTLLKRRALEQREAATHRLTELRERAVALGAEESALFKKWRAFEERHRGPRRNSIPSQHSNGLLSFTADGNGEVSGSPRLSLDLAASMAQMALGMRRPSRSEGGQERRSTHTASSGSSTPLLMPRRPLFLSSSREGSP